MTCSSSSSVTTQQEILLFIIKPFPMHQWPWYTYLVVVIFSPAITANADSPVDNLDNINLSTADRMVLQ